MKEYRVKEYGIGANLGEEEARKVAEVLRDADTLAYGPLRDKFEEDFKEYCGVEYAVAFSSCTAALRSSFQVLGITRGDEVVGTPQTFRATYIGAAELGIKIKFADIDRETLNIDPNTIEDKITDRTKAIVVMHYGGNPVDMDPVMDVARRHNLSVIEDAAHAPGASYKGRKIGAIGDVTCFSFHSLKNMTTLGEGGMMTVQKKEHDEAARQLRTMGILGAKKERAEKKVGKYYAPDPPLHDHAGIAYTHDWERIDGWGTHYRISEVAAAIGSMQVKKLDGMNEDRRKVAEWYNEGLKDIDGIRLAQQDDDRVNVWHLYPCFIDPDLLRIDHTELIQYLENEKKIQMILRFFPVHLSDYMRYFGHEFGECPVCEKVWFEEQLNFPINPRMPKEEVDYVVESLKETIKKFER